MTAELVNKESNFLRADEFVEDSQAIERVNRVVFGEVFQYYLQADIVEGVRQRINSPLTVFSESWGMVEPVLKGALKDEPGVNFDILKELALTSFKLSKRSRTVYWDVTSRHEALKEIGPQRAAILEKVDPEQRAFYGEFVARVFDQYLYPQNTPYGLNQKAGVYVLY